MDRYHVANQVEDMLANAPSLHRNECCIYMVPDKLRKLNQDAYTPKIVSIGPFHHGNPRLLKMEDHKRTYCQKFVLRSDASLDDLVNRVKELEPKLASGWFSFYTEDKEKAFPPSIDSIKHFTDLYRYYRLQSSIELPERGEESLSHLYSATELKEAGVKFMVIEESECFLDLQFLRRYLRIPRFIVEDHTEMILRNMIAFEQCHCPEESYFTDYVELLHCLIKTEKDVNILVDNGIIANRLDDCKAVATMFNGLWENVEVGNSNTNYILLRGELNAFSTDPWHKRMATLRRDYYNTLRRDYCNTPWKTVTSIAAIVLLILTIIQTICSILQVVHK